jgi:hypothetical protein
VEAKITVLDDTGVTVAVVPAIAGVSEEGLRQFLFDLTSTDLPELRAGAYVLIEPVEELA